MWRVALALAILCSACASTPSAPAQPAVTLSWVPVTTLTDGSALTDLSGYVISYGPTGATPLTETVAAPPATIDLAAGSYTFSVAAVSASHGLGVPATITYTVP